MAPPSTTSGERGLLALAGRVVSHPLGWALTTFLLFRGALLGFEWIGLYFVPKAGPCKPPDPAFGPGHDFWNAFFYWDAGWYRSIVLKGYYFSDKRTSSVAFYPLFPYLSRWLGPAVGHPFAAGLVLSHLGTFATIFHLRKLGELHFGREVADRAVILLLVFPTSIFLSAFYTEGLFLGFATASMYHYYRGRYVVCGVLGCLAMLTRSSGLVLFLALGVDLAVKIVRGQARPRPGMLGLLLIPAGLGIFMWILDHQVGDPLAFSKASQFWGRRPSAPWEPIVDAFSTLKNGAPKKVADLQRILDAVTALAYVGIGIGMFVKRYPPAFPVFVLTGTLLPLSTYLLDGMGRYVLALFPAFFFLSSLCQGRPRVERFFLFASVFFLSLYSLRYMRCGWAG